MLPPHAGLLTLIMLSGGLIGQASDLPRFEDFGVRVAFTGKAAPPILDTPRARKFRTRPRLGADVGPNFADHYTVATWGCGSGCHALAIIDAESGKVFFDPTILWVGMCKFREEEPIRYRRDSRLLIIAGARNDQGNGTYYYEWTGTALVPRRSIETNRPCF